ncbi:MAG: hypothetical protein WBL80_06295, partial [Erysipelotrichaceae bacterium]
YEVIGGLIVKGAATGKLEDLPKHFQSIKELVNRSTPMKPILITGDNIVGIVGKCPVCEKITNAPNCCSNNECSQALEWPQ